MSKHDTVTILVHGIVRSSAVMKPLYKFLRATQKMDVINLSYPSTKMTIEEASEQHLTTLINKKELRKYRHVNFVTYSMGSLLLRYALSNVYKVNHYRAVMVAPINNGSRLAQLGKKFCLYRKVAGPAGSQLGIDEAAIHHRLDSRTPMSCGVIAGTRSNKWCPLNKLKGVPNDGRVSVETTKLEGMKDFIELPLTHLELIQDEQVHVKIANYLKRGRFNLNE